MFDKSRKSSISYPITHPPIKEGEEGEMTSLNRFKAPPISATIQEEF